MNEQIADVLAWVVPLVLAVTLHEAAHGWMALRFGDRTAKQLGRVTFNPFKHIDRFGTVVLPGLLWIVNAPFLFGYAKPVPVDFRQLHPARLGMLLVALAGVMVNLALAIASAVLLHVETFVTPEESPWLFMNLYRSLLINCVLIVFNLIPILPLDGGRAVDALLPGALRRWYRKTERYGIVLILLALMVPALLGYSFVQEWIGVPVYWLVERIMWLAGNTQA